MSLKKDSSNPASSGTTEDTEPAGDRPSNAVKSFKPKCINELDPSPVLMETCEEDVTDDSKTCQDVSLDGLTIEDKPKEPKAPTVIKGQKIDLKQHERKKSSSSEVNDVKEIRKITPKVNCNEKIVLCIDMSAELEEMNFQLGDGRKYSGFFMAKRILEIFVHTKHRIDKQHEFALAIMNDTAVWLGNFTNDPRDICNVLEDLHETQCCNSCNLLSLFKILYEKTTLPEMADPSVLPPPHLVRCIFIYGRSNCVPHFDLENQIMKTLLSSHYFFFDVLYIHRQPSNENKCQEVFQALCDIDQNYTSYIFEVSRNPTKLHNYMAMLLAHPLQRPPQNEARYKLKDDIIEVDVLPKETTPEIDVE